MKLPFHKNAYIPKAKLEEYLLSQSHVVGRFKAKFFSSLGFDQTNIDKLEKLLLVIAQSTEVKEVIRSEYGKKYIIDGKMKTPKDKVVKIRTVWIIEGDQKTPRFLTAYPV